MKKAILLGMMMLSSAAFAKVTIFGNLDATKLVLNDGELMQEIAEQSNNGKFIGVAVASAGEGAGKAFTVTVGLATETPIGVRRCFTDVEVKSQLKQVKIPGGGKITGSELKIVGISGARCEK